MLTRLRHLSRLPHLKPAAAPFWLVQTNLATVPATATATTTGHQRRAFGTFGTSVSTTYQLSLYRYPPPFFPLRPVDNLEHNTPSPDDKPSPFHLFPPTRTNGTGDYTLPPLAVGSVLNNSQLRSKEEDADNRQMIVRVIRSDYPPSTYAGKQEPSAASVSESSFVVSFDDQLVTVLRNLSPLLSAHFKPVSIVVPADRNIDSANSSVLVRSLFAKGKVGLQCELLPGFEMTRDGAIIPKRTLNAPETKPLQLLFNGGLPIRTGDPGVFRQNWRYMSIFGIVILCVALNAYFTVTRKVKKGKDVFNHENPDVVRRREEIKAAMEAHESKKQES